VNSEPQRFGTHWIEYLVSHNWFFTLDRILGEPQLVGTQFEWDTWLAATKCPLDRILGEPQLFGTHCMG